MNADAKAYSLPFPVLAGFASKIVTDYRLTKLPMLLIVDTEGKIRYINPFATSDEIQGIIDPILDSVEQPE